LRASQEAKKQAPFIVISDELGETEVEECLRHGVNDCVLKSQFARLPATARRVLEEAQLREARWRKAKAETTR
jgi:PleD family two-component response regulator